MGCLGDARCSSRARLWFVILSLRERCLKQNATPASKSLKRFPSARWLSRNIFLSVPTNRAILIVNCGYSSMLLEKSNTAPFVGTPFLSNFHFKRISPVGSYNADSGIRPTINTSADTITNQIFVKICQCHTISHQSFPRIHLWLMSTDAFIVHILRHDLRCAFNFIIRAAVECMRTFAPHPAVKVHGNNLETGTLRHINIRHPHLYRRFQPCQSLSNLLQCLVSYFLPDCFQRFRCNTENQPTALSIQESTCRVHTVFQFPGSLLQFNPKRSLDRSA